MRLPVNRAFAPIFLSLATLTLVAGCTHSGGRKHAQMQGAVAARPVNGPAADYPVTVGQPFVIDGVTWTPLDTLNYDAVGRAAIGQDGGDAVSAAHKTLPLPSYVEVTSLDSGKTILVRVERRGPMRNDRLVELSPGAAAQLGVGAADGAPVRVRRVNPPETERALLRGGAQAPARMDTPKPLLGVLMRKLPDYVAPAAPVPQPSPVASPLPSPATSRPATAWPAAKSRPAVAPSPKPASTPQPGTTATPAEKPASGSLYVQIGAYSTKDRADRVASAVNGHVIPAGQLWRVRMGPYARRPQADAALVKARGAGYSDARIQRAD